MRFLSVRGPVFHLSELVRRHLCAEPAVYAKWSPAIYIRVHLRFLAAIPVDVLVYFFKPEEVLRLLYLRIGQSFRGSNKEAANPCLRPWFPSRQDVLQAINAAQTNRPASSNGLSVISKQQFLSSSPNKQIRWPPGLFILIFRSSRGS